MAGIKVKYIGHSHVRSFTKSDFGTANIDQGAVSFDISNNWVAELNEPAAEFLLSNDPEFREANDDDSLVRDVSRPEVLNTEVGQAAPVVPLGENFEVHTTEGPKHLRVVEGGKRRGVKARSKAGGAVTTSVGVAGQSSVASSTGTTSSGTSGTSGSSGSSSSG